MFSLTTNRNHSIENRSLTQSLHHSIENFPMENVSASGPTSWPALAATLLEKLTSQGVNPEVSVEFDNMEVQGGPDNARWRVHGAVRIRTRNANDEGGDGR